MYRSAIIFGLYLSFAIAIGASCSPPAPLETYGDDDTSSGATGGNTNGGSTGGSVTTNGGSNPGMGGTMIANGGTGGSLPMNGGRGGSAGSATGGASSGGMTGGAGRANTTGGTAGTASAMGGTGNTTTTGGATGMAGTTSGSAGTGGTGTSTVSCDATFAVSAAGLVRAPMKGACWHGYASAGADADSTGMPTTFAMCGEGCKLNVAGSLAASDESYAYLGFNVNEAGGSASTIKPTGTSVKVTFTKTGTFDVRLQIAAGTKRWCATATSGTAIPWTSLKTECWGTTGTAYAMEAIDQIQLNVPGKMAAATPYDVTLVSVEEM